MIAGPNGAGKTSAAPELLRDAVGIDAFVNADVIAQGLRVATISISCTYGCLHRSWRLRGSIGGWY